MSPGATPPHRLMGNQLDAAWLDWIAHKSEQLETFFSHDVASMPVDRYSMAGIRSAEHALLTRFVALGAPGDGTLARFECYLGQVFVECLDGFWINEPFPDPNVPRATVRFEYTDIRLCAHEQVVLALHHRTGTRWADIYDALSVECTAWWESGRSHR